CARHGGYFDVW
nr:immunoglobulin heavy chain junction region [Mus musculus]NSM04809.1 immunoglobulin heavy chain junction region [Mus musculus]NSM07678.1 immunoglobulin heavy chain junction region [Mus musculus]